MIGIIQSSWRIGVLALVVAAAFLTPSAVPRVDAADNAYRDALQEVCEEDGGEWWEMYDDDGNLIFFGCKWGDDTYTMCSENPRLDANQCGWYMAPAPQGQLEPTQNSPITATDPMAGELSQDPVLSAPATDISYDIVEEERLG